MNENPMSSVSVYAAIELSKSTWIVAVQCPNSGRVKLRQIRGGNTAALVGMLEREQMSATEVDVCSAEIVVCFETGYDVNRLGIMPLGGADETWTTRM